MHATSTYHQWYVYSWWYKPNHLIIFQKKKHTHVVPDDGGVGQKGVAKTFVMERGKVGRLLSQLVLDLRHVMEPHTASKLKVSRAF